MMLYVYGFVDRAGPPMRAAGQPIEIVPCGGFHVALARLEEPPSASVEAVRRQHAIVDRLARTFDAVLPARFGSSLTPASLREIVRLRRTELKAALRELRGCVQMTIRLAEPAVAAEAAGRTDLPPGTAYLERRRAASTIARSPLIERLHASVEHMTRHERVEADAARSMTLLYHAIVRADIRRYRAAIARTAAASGDRVVVTGPYPPYAFAPELLA
jgi:hypothetical protein